MKDRRYIDIHAHLNFKAFADDYTDVLERMEEASVGAINVGTQYDTSQEAIRLAGEHDACAAIVGLHPIHTAASFHDADEVGDGGDTFTSRGETFSLDAYRPLAEDERVVGIGECGLDYYHHDPEYKRRQMDAFRGQIALASEVEKPLMLHIRTSKRESDDAYEDALAILDEVGENVTGNVHFFAGSTAVAEQFLSRGFTLSFTGVITFADAYKELVSYVPLDMLHAETDCPYVSPVPYRGTRNEPTYIREVVQKIADIKGLGEEQVSEQLRENANRVFGV